MRRKWMRPPACMAWAANEPLDNACTPPDAANWCPPRLEQAVGLPKSHLPASKKKPPEALHRRLSELHALGGHVPGVGPVSTSPGTASGAAESRPRRPAWILCNGKYLASNACEGRLVSGSDTLGLTGHEDS